MKELILENDKHKMNWISGTVEWGTVNVPNGIEVKTSSEISDGMIREKYIFTNMIDKDIFTSLRI